MVPNRRTLSHMEPQDYANRVASEVRASIARAGVTAKEVSVGTGISTGTLSRKLRGQVPFDVLELARIADHLGVDAAVFLPQLRAVA